MSYLPVNINPQSNAITMYSPESIGISHFQVGAGAFGATAWPTANVAVFIPFVLRQQTTIYKLFTTNSTTVSGNFDIGIFSKDGVNLVSTGSTAMAGTTTQQVVSITPLTLGPGQYYIGMVVDNTTATFIRYATTAAVLKALGVYNQTSAFPLPATATFASASITGIPVCGLATVANF